MPLTKRSGLSKSAYLVKYFGVAYDDFRKEVWVSCIASITKNSRRIFMYAILVPDMRKISIVE